jgi:serine/threonine protein kinase
VAITPDGKYIVAGTWFDKNGNNHRDSEDYGKVYLFNKDGNLLWSRNLNPTVYDVSISSDGKYIVVAYSNKLSVFDTKGNLLWSYETYRWIYSISITPDGKYIVAGTGSTGDYGRVYLFDNEDNVLWSYNAGFVRYVSITPDGEYIVAGKTPHGTNNGQDDENTIYLFNKNGKLLMSYNVKGKIREKSISISPNGNIVVGTWVDENKDNVMDPMDTGYIYFFDSGGLKWKYHTNEGIHSTSVDFNGKYIVAGGTHGSIYLFNNNGDTLWNYKLQRLITVSIDSYGKYIVVGSLFDIYLFDNQKILEILKEKDNGTLEISSNLPNAKIYIDGKYSGLTPKTIKLPPGTYEITLKKEGYSDYKTILTINGGETKNLNVNLKPVVAETTNTPNTKEEKVSVGTNTNKDNNNLLFIIMGLLITGGVVGGIYYAKKRHKGESKIPDFPRELLNKYIPLQKLGEGGFGKVFKVKRKGGTLPLAIKTPNLNEKAKKYLLKEIKAWKNLNHPNIVKLYDTFTEPIPHIEMEYIEGCNINGKSVKDLDDYPKPLNPKESIKLIKQIAEGLKHAHDKNIIHRDIKPSNILLTQNLTPKITDWGLAKIGAKSSTATTTKGLTLLYSAPEQIDEEEYGKTDKRTDIYQLGVLFYELLTGRLPYEGTSPAQVSLKIVNPDKKLLPPSKINPNLSIFDGIFEKLLAKKKEDRFQSIDEFLEALNSLGELIKEKEGFKNTLTKTIQKLKTSTDKKEIETLTKELINSTTKLALNCADTNDKVGLLEALEILKDHAKSDENRKDLEGAIKHIEYLIKESIPLGKDTREKLKVLINRIKRDENKIY